MGLVLPGDLWWFVMIDEVTVSDLYPAQICHVCNLSVKDSIETILCQRGRVIILILWDLGDLGLQFCCQTTEHLNNLATLTLKLSDRKGSVLQDVIIAQSQSIHYLL